MLEELSRRGVIRTAAVYVAVAWGATEILVFLIDALGGGSATHHAAKYLAIAFVAGFPVALYLAWTRDLGNAARRVVGAAAIAVVGVGGLLWLTPADRERPPDASVASAVVNSLAVLPLENLSGDPDQDYFAAGMTEALIAELSRLGDLRVISRTSMMQYKNTTMTVPEIAAELGVGAIVEGSVLRAGNRIRVTAQLIDASSDHHLWAESFERDMQDVLSLQSDIAHRIADGIGANLIPRVAAETEIRKVIPEAYDAFLRARAQALNADRHPDTAIQAFEEAIELDPTFAPAYAHLSDLYGYLALVTPLTSGDAYLRSRQLARRAIELDPRLPDARAALARVNFQHEWDWDAAEAEFNEALELDPNNVTALDLYGAYRVLIHADCAGGLSLMESARERDPFNPSIHFNLGVYAFHCKQWDESVAQMYRTIELAPNFYRPRIILAWNYLELGLADQAVEQCANVIEEIGDYFDPMAISSCTWVLGRAGQGEAARELFERLRSPPAGTRLDPSWLVAPCVAMGDLDCALESIERAYRARSSNLIFLRKAVQWDPLRENPRFEAIVEEMDFPDRIYSED